MSKGLVFWLLMVLWFVLGLLVSRPAAGQPWNSATAGFNVLLFIILFIIGWAVFGFVIQ